MLREPGTCNYTPRSCRIRSRTTALHRRIRLSGRGAGGVQRIGTAAANSRGIEYSASGVWM